MNKPSVRSFPLIKAYHQKHIESIRKVDLNRGEEVDSFLSSDGQEIKIICQPTIEPHWNIRQIVQNSPPLGWLEVFEDAWTAISIVSDRIGGEGNEFYPLRENIFKVFELCPLNRVRVVIMGQDPYHSTDHQGLPSAQGMSFSVKKGVNIPSSLQNIFKVLVKTVKGFTIPPHGDLTNWVRQGVFLLNADLTVLPHKAKSHHTYWISFINIVLKAIINANPNVIFLLWGREAQKTKDIIGDRSGIFETSHPSGYSARYGFNDCDHFNQVNQKLEELKQPLIDWRIPA
uniref:Uracil-DNA glycosylase n=1 Tax=Pithovirus LCPAC201 TaxID=2506591 RepID=A0A481Z521_9VIRU|nr:MAG: uracil-DNA glycosylase [Pithovirus LCPAC201]